MDTVMVNVENEEADRQILRLAQFRQLSIPRGLAYDEYSLAGCPRTPCMYCCTCANDWLRLVMKKFSMIFAIDAAESIFSRFSIWLSSPASIYSIKCFVSRYLLVLFHVNTPGASNGVDSGFGKVLAVLELALFSLHLRQEYNQDVLGALVVDPGDVVRPEKRHPAVETVPKRIAQIGAELLLDFLSVQQQFRLYLSTRWFPSHT